MTQTGGPMDFDSIELRKVKNGVIVALRTSEEDSEYIFDTNRKALKFVKDLLEGKGPINAE